MTIRQLHDRLEEIIRSNEGTNSAECLDRPIYISVPVSPRRFMRAPLEWVSGAKLRYVAKNGRKMEVVEARCREGEVYRGRI